MTKINRILVFVGVAVYVMLFILVSLFVFKADDESQNYFFPTVSNHRDPGGPGHTR